MSGREKDRLSEVVPRKSQSVICNTRMESRTLFCCIDIFTYCSFFTCTVVSTGSDSHIKDTAELLSRERKERLESNRK